MIHLVGMTAFAALVLSWALVGLVRRYALARAVLDVPSARSSHTVPTPRGGGLGVVLAVLAAGASPTLRWNATPPEIAVWAAVLAVAAVGWIDDHGSLPIQPRLAVHALAGVCIAWLAWRMPGPLGLVGSLTVAWWLVWTVSAINVTNFMDGIDGLIGLQAMVFGIHCVLVMGAEGGGALAAGALAGAAMGFLFWNWSPARIFLGDVGSGPLGLIMVLVGVLAIRAGKGNVVGAYLPLYPMFLDALVTLAGRWRRGERLAEAHRQHLYQRLANGGLGHAKVALLYGLAAAVGSLVVICGRAENPVGPYLAYVLTVPACGLVLDRSVRLPRPGRDGL